MITVARGQLTVAGTVLTLDLQQSAAAKLTGKVLNAGNPVSDVAVTVQGVGDFGPFGSFFDTAYTDAAGSYTFRNVPEGELRLVAIAPDGTAGVGSGTAVAGSVVTVDITLGNAITLPHQFDGADNSHYNLQCDGGLSQGGYGLDSGASVNAYLLSVQNSGFPCMDVAQLLTANREVQFGPVSLAGGLSVTRRVYAPEAGGYMRYLDVLNNTSAVDITVPVLVDSYFSGGLQVLVSAEQSAGRYLVTTDIVSTQETAPGVTTVPNPPTWAHVFSGSTPPIAALQTLDAINGQLRYRWNVTVPAGASVSFMHFTVLRAAGDTDGSAAQAEALASQAQPDMFDGLSSADKASIKNFLATP